MVHSDSTQTLTNIEKLLDTPNGLIDSYVRILPHLITEIGL